MNAVRSPHILTLVIATATNALAMNIFLPSLPTIARDLNADYALVQLMVSLYLVAVAVLQLLLGPASDRFGRRPVMITGLSVFIASTLAAMYAPTIELLLTCRVFQAFSAAGMVLSRAVVRDTVGIDQAASRLGYITMGMALVPMIAPIIGGVLDELYGWRSTFFVTLAYGVLALLVVLFDLNETNTSRTSSFVAQLRAYPELLRARRFWAYSLTAAFTSGVFFAFLGGGPFVSSEILGLQPSGYGFYYALLSLGYMIGNFVSGRFSGRLGINTMMLIGNAVALLGSAISILLFLAGFQHALSLFGPGMLLGIGNGMALPNAMAGIVSVRPKLAGSASGLGGAMQIGGGAACSVLAGAFLTVESGPYPLFTVMLLSAACGIMCTLYGMRVDRQAGPLAS